MNFNNSQTSLSYPMASGLDGQTSHLRNIIELAWTAGFVDGEGCIHISKQQLKQRRNPTYRLTLTVGQNHRGSLERVARALNAPARIYTVKRSLQMNRDSFVLSVNDQDAHRALGELLPYLGRKAPEAKIAIEAYDLGQLSVHPGPKGHAPAIWKIRESYRLKLQRMK